MLDTLPNWQGFSGFKMKYERVTIGITSYNAKDTILDAIKSAQQQDWPNKEILILDDFSTDGSDFIIANYIRGFNDIKLVRQPENRGVAAARNRIITEATGEFIAFFDDDDKSLSDRLRVQINRIKSAEKVYPKSLIVSHTARIQQYPDGKERIETTIGNQNGAVGKAISERILFGKVSSEVIGSCATCSQIARKSVYLELCGFDESLRRSEDTDLMIRLGLAGGVVVGVPEPKVIQRMTYGNEKTLIREHEAQTALLTKYRSFLTEAGWYTFMLQWNNSRLYLARKEWFNFVFTMGKLLLKYPNKFFYKVLWSLPARKSRDSRNKFLRQIQ
jgi:glycosyltransferase involved in cell wall biosynthesis